MSNADRGAAGRERLEWGDEHDPIETTEAAGVEDAADERSPPDDGETEGSETATDAELCSVEDPTCEACQ